MMRPDQSRIDDPLAYKSSPSRTKAPKFFLVPLEHPFYLVRVQLNNPLRLLYYGSIVYEYNPTTKETGSPLCDDVQFNKLSRDRPSVRFCPSAGAIQTLDFGFHYFHEIVQTLCILFESTVVVLDLQILLQLECRVGVNVP
jgi:hypothetical protein